jgi:hypothetical protein
MELEMEVKYIVFSVADQRVPITVDIPGVGVQDVEIPALVVQLVPFGQDHGTLRLQFVGDEIAPAKALFMIGVQINSSFVGA